VSPRVRNTVERGRALPDQIVEALRADIASGTLRSGERLPTEKELCERYGVSRPVVREAIASLKHDGLVITRQGAGAFVAEGGASNVFRLDVGELEDEGELAHIIELLIAVEVAVAEKAARRRTAAQLANLKKALAAIDRSIAAGRDGVEEDMLFHRAVADASGNPYFRELNDFLEARARQFIRTARTNTARLGGMQRVVQGEHAAIYSAIRKRDPVAARRAAESHLRHAAERLALYRREE
jgi:GntR family transcriptional regulator, transcriptional repressor for pyruvate dehydrogenase complex